MTNIHNRDRKSLEKMLQVDPAWEGNQMAKFAIDLDPSTILHAGPPFDSVDEVPEPVMNSAAVALVFEKRTDNFTTARHIIRSGEISLRPAQDYATVVPLAGVVSASMWLHIVVDQNNSDNVAYAPFNGGSGPAIRLGLCNESVLNHLQWINRELIVMLNKCIKESIDLLELARVALTYGDDCHGLTPTATRNLINHMEPDISAFSTAKKFLEKSPSFALNLLMGAAKCLMLGAENQQNSGVVTAAGGNGLRTGIKVASRPNEWLTTPANPPSGHLGEFSQSRALGAIGDSAVVDMLGFGAMAATYAKQQRKAFGDYLPTDADQLPSTLLSCIHDKFGSLQFRTGLSVRTVVQRQVTPIVSLGVIDREGTAGRLGGGIYRYPLSLFQTAHDRLESN